MDNDNTVLTESSEDLETSGAFDEGWDEGWNEGFPADGPEPEDTPEDSPETEEESEETEADADQQDADGTEGEQTDGAESEEPAAGEESASPDQGDSFELRWLGESRTVNRDEVIKLAQQGMDYQRIREKWDSVKDDMPKLRMYEGFLKELAESRGGDIDSLIDETRTRSLIAKAKAAGKDLPASAAAAQAVQARMKAMEPEEAKKQKDSEEEQMAKRRASVDRFVSLYGDTVKKVEDIPKEVWDDAEKIGDLTIAYQKYTSGKLEAENKRLQKELEQAKQQKKNRERSMGSSKSVGAAAARDAMDDGWDEGWNA